MHKRIKTLIVDDSIIVRHVLSEILNSDPAIELIGAVEDPFYAIEAIAKQRPDVIVLDIEMPRMDGISFLRKIMQEDPIPVVMCSSLTEKGAHVTVEALSLGALDIITKPKAGIKGFLHESRVALLEAIKAAAGADLKKLLRSAEMSQSTSRSPTLNSTPNHPDLAHQIIAIGASTGGVQALELVLADLPLDSPAVLVVQHMSSEFTPAFAKRLNEVCNLEVVEARDQDRVVAGRVLLAPGHKHMVLNKKDSGYVVELKNGPVIKRHRPSIDVLMRSVAKHAGSHAVGVILTGMGDDGVIGLREIQRAGGYTIAQDETTSVVYGMPQHAVTQSVVNEVVALEHIADCVLAHLSHSA